MPSKKPAQPKPRKSASVVPLTPAEKKELLKWARDTAAALKRSTKGKKLVSVNGKAAYI